MLLISWALVENSVPLFSVKSFIEANGQTVTAYISPSLKDIKEKVLDMAIVI